MLLIYASTPELEKILESAKNFGLYRYSNSCFSVTKELLSSMTQPKVVHLQTMIWLEVCFFFILASSFW